MMGVFVQINEESGRRHLFPLGYVIQENGCWDWVGATTYKGYGRFRVKGVQCAAHRVMYERDRGPIPAGLTLDHLCRNRLCVNPDHLEAVSVWENTLRGNSPSARMARATHCIRGHNDWVARKAPFSHQRQCRSCQRLKEKHSMKEGK